MKLIYFHVVYGVISFRCAVLVTLQNCKLQVKEVLLFGREILKG